MRRIQIAISSFQHGMEGRLEPVSKSHRCGNRQKHIPISFEGMAFPGAFRLDLIVEKRLIVEIKSVDQLIPLHKAQLTTYLKMTGLKSGLLINFNSSPLKDGIKRVEVP
ncbi:MAG: GxxExxY protein [Gemmatimonadaceae bacterium]|nr:GxxExxY protein [Gemmatimonadaceae bacterium]